MENVASTFQFGFKKKSLMQNWVKMLGHIY